MEKVLWSMMRGKRLGAPLLAMASTGMSPARSTIRGALRANPCARDQGLGMSMAGRFEPQLSVKGQGHALPPMAIQTDGGVPVLTTEGGATAHGETTSTAVGGIIMSTTTGRIMSEDGDTMTMDAGEATMITIGKRIETIEIQSMIVTAMGASGQAITITTTRGMIIVHGYLSSREIATRIACGK